MRVADDGTGEIAVLLAKSTSLMKCGQTPALALALSLRCRRRRSCRVRGSACCRPNALRGAADATCRLPARILLTIADDDAAGR
jgi:hypothetical protein